MSNIRIQLARCLFTYRKWVGDRFSYEDATCPYHGDTCINAAGYTVDPKDDRCGKTINDCKARFGDAPLPFAGFPEMVIMG